MSHTQQPPAAGQQHAPQQGQGQVVASAQQKGMAEGIRLVVQAQPTLVGSVAAVLQAVANVITDALKNADATKLQALADGINSDLGAWSFAVLANTPLAVQTAAPFQFVPGYLEAAFQTHAKQSAPASPQSGQAQPHH